MTSLPQPPKGPPQPSAGTQATPPAPPRDLLADMIGPEREEVNWAFARAGLSGIVAAHFEAEMRRQRERCRAVIAAVGPHLVSNEQEDR